MLPAPIDSQIIIELIPSRRRDHKIRLQLILKGGGDKQLSQGIVTSGTETFEYKLLQKLRTEAI